MPLTVRDNHRFISIIGVSGGFLGTVMDTHRHISIVEPHASYSKG